MAEMTIDLHGMPLAEAYEELASQTYAVLEGIDDDIAAMATMSALIHNAFGHLWTGFYRVVEPGALLRVGPYQGTLGCLEIRFGKGVCGTAAQRRESVLVPDVEAFPGHIACDSASRSELVVPIVKNGELIGVLDLDSPSLERFDEQDRAGCETLVRIFVEAL